MFPKKIQVRILAPTLVMMAVVAAVAGDSLLANEPHGQIIASAADMPRRTFGPTIPTRFRRIRRHPSVMQRHARRRAWHGRYFDTQYGWPVAQVTPPTANFQTSYSWGVGMTEMVPIYHQFQRPYAGEVSYSGEPFSPTPRWPGHTDQFGRYYIRGPW